MFNLDPLLMDRVRLGIISALAVNEELSFVVLRELLGVTDGNLSVHARKLEDAGYVVIQKQFEGRKPKSNYRLTVIGRKAFEQYLDEMEQMIREVRGG
ncbi:MAG TPA: transcriptional regulator [Rhodothermales bacterium]|nr:transcriptional regulator [Bacteroidota bacterium]HRK74134.1 transcriptional regulator [Rhodothermales bacterium]HRR08616.1 transcriptional regulator [Rhodothermales bacterium]